jgi:hypothetical protein
MGKISITLFIAFVTLDLVSDINIPWWIYVLCMIGSVVGAFYGFRRYLDELFESG